MKKTLSFLVLANFLLAISFLLTDYFWMLFPVSLFILIIVSMIDMRINLNRRLFTFYDISYGILTGTILYGVFLVAYLILKVLPFPLITFVEELYLIVGPRSWWHYLMLVLIIIPGEEIFWRRYLQSKLVDRYGILIGFLAGASMYALTHIWTGNPMLVAAAATAGLAWGALYAWKNSLALVIISHLVFDLWLLVIFPLNF
ncbi:CPBP family intramembrane glutamic endopeptidase [Sutcliffiella horikoshii]|uniref:CPBP family intramembrane metalloprotease n=1 Tax=Sutcliffiella horikoshii TaxID=79883 RepID=A0A5D4THD4_9BACI|nr:CPBP family intramembrane glutamic endopeptidase [Sutcliffiella horikoshii]TYS73544.1 CPBP family intramembrane metalloprotease [Sutcliffiella horikoshii]